MKINKTVKLIGKILFYIVFVAVLLLVIGMMISKISNRVFFVGNRAMLWVVTDSMEEQIPERSYIEIRKIDPSEIKEGDIITFYSDDPSLQGHLNTHRVVEISADGTSFVTKGDNNVINDKYPVRAEAVIGVYEENLEIMTAIGRAFQTKIGLFLSLTLITVIVAVSFASEPIKKMLNKNGKDTFSYEQK